MGKRKASVFTVVESVDNWFEASRLPSTITETIEERTGSVVADPALRFPLITTQGETNQSSVSRPRLAVDPSSISSAPTRVVSPGDVAVPPRINDATSRDRPLLADLDLEKEASLRALWALLEDIGYETW